MFSTRWRGACLCLGHRLIGIRGNSAAESAAKNAIDNDDLDLIFLGCGT